MYRTGTLLGRMSNECPPRYVRRNDVYRSLCTIATPNVADDGHSPTFVRRYLQFNSVLYVPRPGGLVAADRVAGFSLWLSSCMSVTTGFCVILFWTVMAADATPGIVNLGLDVHNENYRGSGKRVFTEKNILKI
ncbi:hypothetical protein QTP88_008144 [Uroleucon formosanum]